MAPFNGWGSTASRLEPLQGGSLPFITKNLPISKRVWSKPPIFSLRLFYELFEVEG